MSKVSNTNKKIKTSPRQSETKPKGRNSMIKEQRPKSKVNVSNQTKKKTKKLSQKVKVVENEKRLHNSTFFNYGIYNDSIENNTVDDHKLKDTFDNSITCWKNDDTNELPYQAIENQSIEFSQLLDSDILMKEYELGKQLISHASQKLEEKSYSGMLYDSKLTQEDLKIIGIFLSLLYSIKDNKDIIIENWDNIQQILSNPSEVFKMQNDLSTMIEKDKFIGENTHKFRDQFVNHSSYESQLASILAMKEYLCEAFCLIDIIEEIKAVQQKLTTLVNPQTPQDKNDIDKQNQNDEKDKELKDIELVNKAENIMIENEIEANNDSISKEIMKDIRSKYYATPEFSINEYCDSNINSINSSVIVPNTAKNANFDGYKPLSISSKYNEKYDNKHSSSKKNLKAKPKIQNERKSSDIQYKFANKQTRNSERKVRNNTAISNKRCDRDSSRSKASKYSDVKPQIKKAVTPYKPPQKTLEKLESRLPSTMGNYHQTKRKTPRTSMKPSIKKEINNRHNYSPIRCTLEYCNQSPKRKGVTPALSPKRRKSPNRNTDTMSPTKRMILMKNSYIKNQKKAQKDPSNNGKLIYTISPDEAYIVDKEFYNYMETEDLAKKSEELCKTADKQRSQMYGDSMVKYHHRRELENNNYA